jgi:uncharacterized membrane protein (UPF0127 family)
MSLDKLLITFILLLVPIGFFYWYTSEHDVTLSEIFTPKLSNIRIGDFSIPVEIARTDAEREKGLSGRDSLPPTKGLLFMFPDSDYHQFWMKDMNFSIDIIWISEDLEVIGIDRGISPDTYPRTFRPSQPVKYVLETNAEYADTYGLAVGQKVRLPLE